jgi:hypothetical protein
MVLKITAIWDGLVDHHQRFGGTRYRHFLIRRASWVEQAEWQWHWLHYGWLPHPTCVGLASSLVSALKQIANYSKTPSFFIHVASCLKRWGVQSVLHIQWRQALYSLWGYRQLSWHLRSDHYPVSAAHSPIMRPRTMAVGGWIWDSSTVRWQIYRGQIWREWGM